MKIYQCVDCRYWTKEENINNNEEDNGYCQAPTPLWADRYICDCMNIIGQINENHEILQRAARTIRKTMMRCSHFKKRIIFEKGDYVKIKGTHTKGKVISTYADEEGDDMVTAIFRNGKMLDVLPCYLRKITKKEYHR